jgi:hypothetical protein
MLTQMLITAAKEAKYFRQEDGESSPTYKAAIDKIDEINHYIRASNPEKYWQDTDSDYRLLTSKWAAHRAVTKARNAD